MINELKYFSRVDRLQWRPVRGLRGSHAEEAAGGGVCLSSCLFLLSALLRGGNHRAGLVRLQCRLEPLENRAGTASFGNIRTA